MFSTRKAISTVEYTFLILIVLGVLFAMWPYIKGAMTGKWKSSGESFGYGRRFDPTRSTECSYAQTTATFGMWFDNNCYQHAVTSCAPADIACENAAKASCKTQACCENNTEAPGGSNCG